jgi:hypothetical protein
MAITFLHVNDGNYSVIVCFSKIAATIIVLKKLVKMGKKFLFICVLCTNDQH